MEEILASIRRIIADDDATKTAKPPAAGLPPAPPPAAMANSQNDVDAMLAQDEPPPAAPASDVLDLTEAMAAPAEEPEPEATFRTIDAASDVVFTDRVPDPPIIEEPHRPPPALDSALISGSTMAAVNSAFNSLAHTVIGQNARTLEDLVKEMLRPMLKSWLDDNLPGLVDRIVRAEIERVSRGR